MALAIAGSLIVSVIVSACRVVLREERGYSKLSSRRKKAVEPGDAGRTDSDRRRNRARGKVYLEHDDDRAERIRLPDRHGRRSDGGSDDRADERAHATVGASADRFDSAAPQRSQVRERGIYFTLREFLAADVCKARGQIA